MREFIKEFLEFYNKLQLESLEQYDFNDWISLNNSLCKLIVFFKP